jgi:tRNA/rRNA methyltransferase
MDLTHCRVVLVGTEVAGNLGATARVMRNMGLSDLRLVSPQARPDDNQARQFSTHGEEILKNARIVPNLKDALADCILAIGTSARLGGPYRRQSVRLCREIGPLIVQTLASGHVALVFGREPSGLTNEEITQCHYLVHIPTDPGYGALNLAQAVAICLYEVRWAALETITSASAELQPANHEAQSRMFDHLRKALEEIHFLYGDTADSLMHALRHLIGRALPTEMELGVLHGLARQMLWMAARNNPLSGGMFGGELDDAKQEGQEP